MVRRSPPVGWPPRGPSEGGCRAGTPRSRRRSARPTRPRARRTGRRSPSARRPRRARGSGRRAPRRSRRPPPRAARRPPITRAGARCVTATSAGSRPSAAQCSCSTATLWRTVSGSPKRLHASAWRATSRSVRRSPEPPTRIGIALLQRPRVAGRLLDRDRAALEARRARAPHQRQQLERVLEQRVALAQRREVPAVEAVLALEPRGAEAAHRAAAGEHVERRDDLREVGEVAVRDPGDERPERGSAR